MKMNDASQATGVPASPDRSPLGGRRPRGGQSARSPARSPARPKSPGAAQARQARAPAHPRRAGPGDRGLGPTGWKRSASRPPSTANSELGLSISGHRFTTGPQAPACFDRDVTSDFFFRFLDRKRPAPLQPRGLPGPPRPPRRAVLDARVLQRQGHCSGPLGQVPGPSSPLGPAPSSPSPRPPGLPRATRTPSRRAGPLRHHGATAWPSFRRVSPRLPAGSM